MPAFTSLTVKDHLPWSGKAITWAMRRAVVRNTVGHMLVRWVASR